MSPCVCPYQELRGFLLLLLLFFFFMIFLVFVFNFDFFRPEFLVLLVSNGVTFHGDFEGG